MTEYNDYSITNFYRNRLIARQGEYASSGNTVNNQNSQRNQPSPSSQYDLPSPSIPPSPYNPPNPYNPYPSPYNLHNPYNPFGQQQSGNVVNETYDIILTINSLYRDSSLHTNINHFIFRFGGQMNFGNIPIIDKIEYVKELSIIGGHIPNFYNLNQQRYNTGENVRVYLLIKDIDGNCITQHNKKLIGPLNLVRSRVCKHEILEISTRQFTPIIYFPTTKTINSLEISIVDDNGIPIDFGDQYCFKVTKMEGIGQHQTRLTLDGYNDTSHGITSQDRVVICNYVGNHQNRVNAFSGYYVISVNHDGTIDIDLDFQDGIHEVNGVYVNVARIQVSFEFKFTILRQQ